MPDTRLRLAFLWHLHQPMYRDPRTGEYILPWVRLHATRSYYDMPRVLAEFPRARATINLVPSLIVQLDDYIQGRAKDRFLDLTERRAEDLDAEGRAFVLRNFFMVDWDRCVRPLPRYWELLQKRGAEVQRIDLLQVQAQFSAQELRDLQVLFNLAWFGFKAEEEEPLIGQLKAKGRGFTEDEKRELLAVQMKILRSVVPALAAVGRSGQAELTVTPFYHPILPLLCDSDAARRAMPSAQLPTRFAFPEDAHDQVRRALDLAETRLGIRPRGMWPAEGSVSPEALAVFADEGVEYVCSDEEVLLRSLANPQRGEALPHTYRVAAGDKTLQMLFRDRGLSDLIGFTYARTPAGAAVGDFLSHLSRIADARSPEVPTVGVILDGENPWEHYPASGRDFLRTLYRSLDERASGIEPVTLGEAFKASPPTRTVSRIHSGSWIQANYRIWIGHPEDNLGWELLGMARRLLAERIAAGFDAQRCQQARESLEVAEGSDWFWWYGDDFATESAAEFDALFRAYVTAAFELLDAPVPPRLREPIAERARVRRRAQGPVAREPDSLINPPIDGMDLSYFGWAGAVEIGASVGRDAMFQADGLVAGLRYGFSLDQLFLRVDTRLQRESLRDQVSEVMLEIRSGSTALVLEIPLSSELAPLRIRGAGTAVGKAVFRDILTLSVPFASLGLQGGARIGLALMLKRGEVVVERIPGGSYLELTVPGPDFERIHWKV
jgi:alpha-amylase/alpha-mannosidase (GH57 family)